VPGDDDEAPVDEETLERRYAFEETLVAWYDERRYAAKSRSPDAQAREAVSPSLARRANGFRHSGTPSMTLTS
jgi:hypothetical protein